VLNTILIVNDNHFVVEKNEAQFKQSKFHLFIKGFLGSNVFLSSPTLNIDTVSSDIVIDGVNVLPRFGYGTAINFYKKLPLQLFKHFRLLYGHIKKADTVLLVAPACTLPISYLICRALKKPLAIYMVGDIVEVVRQDKTSFCIIRAVKVGVVKLEWCIARYIMKRHIAFVLGCSIYDKISSVACDLSLAMTSLVEDTSIVQPVKKILKKTDINILTVSRLSTEKSIDTVLDAIANLSNEFSITYTVVGDGPEMDSLISKASCLGLSSHVKFTGYLDQEEIRRKYLSSDIFILPSLSEGIPKVILDAMAASVPIISTNVGGIPDLLSIDQSRGWLNEPSDILALEVSIRECINNDVSRFSKVLNANQYIKQHTLTKEAGKIETKLLSMLDVND
jgi:glycosyltransferase involved in cell wall biosynthesis